MSCGTKVKFGTLRRRKSILKLNKSEEKDFDQKRELEKKIRHTEVEIDKGSCVSVKSILQILLFQAKKTSPLSN